MKSDSLVDAKELQYVRLYKERESLYRLDVFPFIIIYGAWVFYQIKSLIHSTEETKSTLFISLSAFLLIAIHILIYLFTIWSVDVRCIVRYRRVYDLDQATLIKVVPHELVGKREVVRLEHSTLGGRPYCTFSLRKLRFVFDQSTQVCQKLHYPTKLTFAEYRASTGYSRESDITNALDKWGTNTFEVPIPQFLDLLREQLVAPFFCFQVFCVALWALDEFWYYSLMTLVMLVTFESTVVHQRLRNLAQVRALQEPRQPLKVYRCGKWIEISGDALVPGDLVSLARPRGADTIVVQADMLLLAGNCIVDEAVLTGESTPQWKNPIGEATGDEVDASELAPTSHLNIKRDKMHVVFGGTKLLQTTGDKEAHIRAPEDGCLAVVLRTGFETAQGRLMRTILYSTERMTANNIETFMFILFLLLWAIAASYYVLREGLADPDRDRFKLILNCIMILTSVVPPELPMELTIAVNASLVALARKKVFCTEPFRIPLAGKITTCCFDKTGTLTSDHMVLEGIAGSESDIAAGGDGVIGDIKSLSPAVIRALSCCQSLVQIDGALVGDPVERAAIDATGWAVRGDAVSGAVFRENSTERETAHILHRFHFSSALKRMSTIAKIETAKGATEWCVMMKGAPETVARHLQRVPEHYDRCCRKYAAEGARVLALAKKQLPADLTPSALRHIPRDEAESELTFVGFAVFRSPLKDDSEPALRMLRASEHQLVMITGDAPLTACHTAAQVHIITMQPLILSTAGPPSAWLWRSPDESISEPFDPSLKAARQLSEAYDLCLTGDALQKLPEAGGPDVCSIYIAYSQVFARVTPEQKELVVKTLRNEGLGVLMCGDGTNDVGALKGAHVGVALLPPPEKLQQKDMARAGGANSTAAQQQQQRRRPPQQQSLGGSSQTTATPASAVAVQQQQRQLGKAMQQLELLRSQGKTITPLYEQLAQKVDEMNANQDMGEAPMVKPGDASMASPFTAKDPSVMPCLDILRQGRCTLVTTVQMFKILGLLSLSTAYSLSVLYLDGIKLGDSQATMAGLLTAGMFFFISNAQPLNELSRERPHPRIFSLYVFTSLLGQFAVHMAFLMNMQYAAHAMMLPEERQAPDGDFKPNLINTVCFLANFAIQTMTFAVNYVGVPFNTPLNENKMFALSVRWSSGMFFLLVLDIVYGLNDWFSLVVLPWELKMKMLGYGIGAFLTCTVIERGARRAFPAKLPPRKGGLYRR